MARQLRRTTRIFTRKRSAWSRALSAAVLSLALGVAIFGFGTAVYLERARSPDAPPPESGSTTALVSAEAVTPAPAPPHDPLAAAAAVPLEPPPSERGALPAIEPQAEGPRAEAPPAERGALPAIEPRAEGPLAESPPPQIALLEPPAGSPAPSTAPLAIALPPEQAAEPEPVAQYWVEYGVFAGERYARRLQQALAEQGLDTRIVRTHTPQGRPLLRVRSDPTADLAAARAAAAKAERALTIGTLVHRAAPSAASAKHYWVRFGTFPTRQQAAQLRHELRKGGIAASVSMVGAKGDKPLYIVRSLRLPDRLSATTLAAWGREMADVDGLIEERASRAYHSTPPPHNVAQSR